METLLTKEETAKLYKKGGKADVKKLLEKLHKKEDLIIPAGPLTDWKDIARLFKMHPVNSLPYTKPKSDRDNRMNTLFVMDVMTEYFNTDPISKKVWEPKPGDWGNRVWYDFKPGVGFVFYASYCVGVLSDFGSRLHFKDGTTGKLAAMAMEKYQNLLFKNPK